MTKDNEIIKAWECCISDINKCNDCPYYETTKLGYELTCNEKLESDVLDLLRKANKWKNSLMRECMLSKCSREKEVKAEAYKEVADRLFRYIYGETNNMIYLTKIELEKLIKERIEELE